MDQDFVKALLLAGDVTGFCFIAVDYHLNIACYKSLLLMWPKGSNLSGITKTVKPFLTVLASPVFQ